MIGDGPVDTEIRTRHVPVTGCEHGWRFL